MNAATRAREAALLVHSLPLATRDQVLQRLDAAERAQVEPLLAELVSLGIPSLPAERLDALRMPAEPQDDLARVRALSASQLLAVLHDAGPATLALLLRMGDWPWKADLLARLEDPRRERTLMLCDAQADAAMPRAVTDALCKQLLTRVTRIDKDVPPAVAPRPHWTKWFAWSR